MILSEENRNAIVNYRLQKAKITLSEIKGIVAMKYWHVAANRLYYAAYYAVTALLIKNGYTAHTHHGVFTVLGKHFVLEGIISRQQNELYGTLLELRQKGDYNDFVVIEEHHIMPLLEPVEQFISAIEKLINTTP